MSAVLCSCAVVWASTVSCRDTICAPTGFTLACSLQNVEVQERSVYTRQLLGQAGQ